MDWSGLAHFCSKMPVWPNALLKKTKIGCDWPGRLGLSSAYSSLNLNRNVTVLEVLGVMNWPELANLAPKFLFCLINR